MIFEVLMRSSITIDLVSEENCSTDVCVSFFMTKFLKGFEEGLLTGMILIDLQKAFDTVNHAMLSRKLCIIGSSDDTIKCFHQIEKQISLNAFNVIYQMENILKNSRIHFQKFQAYCVVYLKGLYLILYYS